MNDKKHKDMTNFDFQQTAPAIQELLNSIPDKATKEELEQLRELYEALTKSNIVPVPSADWPVSNPQENVIYRVAGTSSYTDYMWDGTSFIPMATYDIVPTDIPSVDSTDVITAGGVANHGSAFDISEYNKNGATLATYANLSAALAAVPSSVQKGGMSIKFVRSSDNKYVQFRYMGTDVTTAATFTNTANWQGVGNITAGSENIAKSGSVYTEIYKNVKSYQDGVKLNNVGNVIAEANCIVTEYLDVTGFASVRWEFHSITSSTAPKLCVYDEDMVCLGYYGQTGSSRTISLSANIKYVRATFDWNTYGYDDWKIVGIDSNNAETVLWDTSHLVEKKLKDAVLFTPQTLTDAQKLQARTNIGAGSDAVSFVNLHQVAPYDGSSSNEYPDAGTARGMLPTAMKKLGVVITYKCGGLWIVEQMKGTFYSTEDAYWETLAKSETYSIDDIHRQVTGEITGMYIGATGNNREKFTAKAGYFITPVIPVGNATSIVWNYVSKSTDTVKFDGLDENMDMVGLWNQVNGSSRTIDISSYPAIKYIRATFEEANRENCSLVDNNGNVLWSGASQGGGSGTSDVLGESKMVYGNTSVELKVYANSQRLNPNGTLVGYSGFVTSRAFIVNKGDTIHYIGTYDKDSMAFAVGFSDRQALEANKTESFVGTVKDGTQDIFFKVTNANTKYIRVCSHTTVEGGQTVDPSLFAVDIIPTDGFISDVAENLIGNYFPNALSKATPFVQKLLNGEDVQICLLGDSVTQIANQTANNNPESLPPFMERKNWCYWLWKGINKTKDMICRRSDYENFFTLTGTFSSPDEADNSFNNAYSTDGNAAFAFDWNLGTYEKTNLVMPINGAQSNDIKIAVLASGTAINGKVEYYDAYNKTWVEANGVSLSFLRLSGSAGNQLACNNNRYKLRRKSGVTGNVTIKVYKNTSDSDRLQFWGVEQWNGQGIFISNAAYGGYGTYELQPGNTSNIKERFPDLVLFELTLVNNFGDRLNEANSKELMINDFYDYIWGDRSDNANSLALKAISNNWQDWQMLGVIPHYRKQWMDGDDFRTYVEGRTIAYTANECYNAVKALFVTKDDVNFVDMGAALKWEAHRRGWTMEQSYDGDENSDMKSFKTFTQDTVHLNDFGSKIYGNYLAPIFDLANLT